jgi:hypothetical protein
VFEGLIIDAADFTGASTVCTAGYSLNSSEQTVWVGSTGQFTVVLDGVPADDVVFTVVSADEHVTVLTPTLTFNSEDWRTPKTVSFTGATETTTATTITIAVDDGRSHDTFDDLADKTFNVAVVPVPVVPRTTPPPADLLQAE